ncbi:phage tail protein [Tistrella mobilis]|jgi:phage protein U
MTTLVMLALGEFRFSIATAAYQTLRRAAGYRWAAIDRIGRRPALQWIGPGAETIDLDGIIYPHYRGGLGQVPRLRALAAAGTPQVLVSGLGEVLGRWVVTSVEESGTRHIPEGAPLRIDFRISLSIYGDDGPGTAGATAVTENGAAGREVR